MKTLRDAEVFQERPYHNMPHMRQRSCRQLPDRRWPWCSFPGQCRVPPQSTLGSYGWAYVSPNGPTGTIENKPLNHPCSPPLYVLQDYYKTFLGPFNITELVRARRSQPAQGPGSKGIAGTSLRHAPDRRMGLSRLEQRRVYSFEICLWGGGGGLCKV